MKSRQPRENLKIWKTQRVQAKPGVSQQNLRELTGLSSVTFTNNVSIKAIVFIAFFLDFSLELDFQIFTKCEFFYTVFCSLIS